jgi:protein TonB
VSFAKTVVVSVFLHLGLFTAALLLSANLSGGSSKLFINKVIFVDLFSDHPQIKKSRTVSRHNKSQKDKQLPQIKTKDESMETKQHRIIQTVDPAEDNEMFIKQKKLAESTKDILNDPYPDIQEHYVSTNTSTTSNNSGDNLSADIQEEGVFSDNEKDGDSGSINSAFSQSTDNNNRLFIKITEIIRRYIERAKSYPLVARKRGIEGTVYVKFRINPDGQPVEIQIVRSSGSEILDKGALKIIKNAGPFPYINGVLEIPISFRLTDR